MTTTVTVHFKEMVQLTPHVKEFLKKFTTSEIDETAEWLAVTDDGQLFFVKDFDDLSGGTYVPKTQLMTYYIVTDFDVEFPV